MVRGEQRVRIQGSGRRAVRRVAVRARAEAELRPTGPAGMPAMADGGGYKGPLAYRNGKPMRPDVARAFDRMAAAARREADITLTVTSGFRSDAEQAKLFAANPNPKWVAPPGRSLHRLGTELDLGPPAAYGWLARNSRRFGFVKRYAWALRPVSVGTARALTGGGSVAQRTAGLDSGRLLVGMAFS